MSKIPSSRKASRFWVRFWIPVLISLCLTPVLFCLGVGPAMIGLGSHTSRPVPLAILFPILFPYTALIHSNRLVYSDFTFVMAFFALPLIQFPVYGIILGFANAKRILILAVCILLIIHLLAIGFAFMYMH